VLPAVAQTHGYALSFRVGAAVLAVAGVLVLVLLEYVSAKPRTALAEVAADQAPSAPSVTRATP
jgi:multidrug resistance efflux pump